MPSPLGHSLMGAALFKEGSSSVRDRQWPALALFVFLANAPDLDFIPGLVLAGDPMLFHRLITHSLAFVFIAAACVYAAMKAFGRPYAGRIAQAVVFGLLSHLALDYFCGGADEGIAMMWPLSPERLSSPIRVFPGLSPHPLIATWNLQVALIEISVMMILMQVSSLHRIWAVARHKRVANRRAADGAKGVDLTPAAD